MLAEDMKLPGQKQKILWLSAGNMSFIFDTGSPCPSSPPEARDVGHQGPASAVGLCHAEKPRT